MPKGILNLNYLGVDEKYLTLKPHIRKMMCREIILQSFKRMSVNHSIEIKTKTMASILKRSIAYYENEERYEECVILTDLLNILKEEYK